MVAQNIDAEKGDIVKQYSDTEKAKACRKLDWNLIPPLGVLHMLSYIDRGNVGNAYTAGLGKDWGITSNQYSWIITAYDIASIAFHWFILL
ncbi:hypothetical protein BJY01DRAFT_243358 [Aspergillus pseudoustus]|uniref:Major facilitator superfamily domain-containing protein n=1 Tax=Aspergillus pseudoustus TaxID=1810923 RepID=A0ABR4KTQ1_9EURO